MSKKLKKQLGKIMSVILSVAMLVGTLPADLLGGIASVSAAENADAAAKITYEQGEWAADGETQSRTTTWEFVTKSQEAGDSFTGATINEGDTACGITALAGKVSVKMTGQGFTLGADASASLPLDKDTTSVVLKITMASTSSGRAITVGDAESVVLAHGKELKKGEEYTSEALGAGYMTVADDGTKTLKLTNGIVEGGSAGDSKIGQITIVETKAAGGSEEGGGGESGGGGDTGNTDTESKTYVLESKDLAAFAQNAKQDSETETAGTDGFFTLIYSTKSAINESSKTWTDGYTSGQRINFGGKADVKKNSIKFTTTNAATVKIWFVQGGSDNRQMVILNEGGTEVTATALEGMAQNSPYYGELELEDAGTYYLGGKTGNNYIYKVEVDVAGESGGETPANVEATVTVENKELLSEGDTIKLVDAEGKEVAVTDGGKVTLTVGAAYTAAVKTAEGTAKEGFGAKINGENSVTAAADTTELKITVISTKAEVTPSITFAEGSDFGTNKLYAVNGTKKEVELKNGEAALLEKETLYSLVVKDAEGKTLAAWKADANASGKAEFTTSAEEKQTVAIVLTKVANVKVTPVIEGKDLLGTSNKVVLTVGGDSVEVVSGKELSLLASTTYDIEIKDANGKKVDSLEALVDSKKTYTTGAEDGAEVTIVVNVPVTKKTTWDKFAKTDGTPELGQELPSNPGILYQERGTSSGCSYDGTLRFRPGVVLYLLLQDSTTKVTYAQTCSATNAGRPTYVGGKDSGYQVEMTSTESSVTIDDVTDLVVTLDGKRYLPIESGGDVKIKSITLTEYSPVNEVTVSGTVSGVSGKNITEIKFKNLDNPKAELVKAVLDGSGKYTAKLRRVAGRTNYAAVISAVGYKIDDANDADKFTLLGNDATATQDFSIAEAPVATVSGKITGITDVKGDLGVSLIPDNTALAPIELTVTKGANNEYTYKDAVLEAGRKYTVELTNADDFEVTGEFSVAKDETTHDIAATPRTTYEVSGKLVTSDKKTANVTKITFTNMDKKEYSYTFDVKDGAYTAKLRTAEYETSVDGSDYTAFDHVSVKDAAVTNDVYLQGAVDTSAVEYKAEVTVGEGKDFSTIAEAVAYISRMTRTDDQRVTIVLEKGKVYREQLVIDTPNITIKGNGSTITWYYGVGFSYYSAKLSSDGKSAYYDEAYAVDKYTKTTISQNPGHWGATVNLLAGAKGFAAEDLTFENSLNRYMTKEEIADGADGNTDAGVTRRTDENIDVLSKKAKERACVLYIQADDTTYKNCNLLSRQDTLYTGDADENSYFLNCTIEGNVDYICGDGNPVFDKCTLSMYGYPEASTGAYIVANKAKAKHGYLFNNCKIVQSSQKGLLPTTENILVRAWDAGTVVWLNTEVATADMISAVGYADMNATVAASHYYEYNTHTPDGKAVDVSGRPAAGVTIMTKAEAEAVELTSYFDGWKPLYYEGKIMLNDLNLKITAPVAGEAPDTSVSLSQTGVTLKSQNVTWYEEGASEAFTGAAFGDETVYVAKVDLQLDSIYGFGPKLNVAGDSAALGVDYTENKDGSVTVSVRYATGITGLYDIDLSQGLKKGVEYPGGISVLEDMAAKGNTTVDGVEYPHTVQGTGNPSPNKGEIPASGAVLVLNAEKDGKLTVVSTTTGKTLHFVHGSDKTDELNTSPSAAATYTFSVTKGETYYFYGDGTKVVLASIVVNYSDAKPGDWSKVAAPEIVDVAVGQIGAADTNGAKPGEIKVRAKGLISLNGGDKIEVDMIDARGNVVDTQINGAKNYTAKEPVAEVTFTPTASGEYTFIARLVRSGEKDKTSAESKAAAFVLPMGHAVIASVTNKCAAADAKDGDLTGALEVVWSKVPEARSYTVTVVTSAKTYTVDTTSLSTVVKELPVGETVTVSVTAHGGDEKNVSVPSKEDRDLGEYKVTNQNNRTWTYAAFGSGVDTKNNSATPKFGADGNLESVNVKSTGGKGKIVPGSTDGLAYYYTAIDPATENFTLTAKVSVNTWTLSNGQDGFGMMVADAVGEDGNGTAFWNNSYQLLSSKIEYYWDASANEGKGAVTTSSEYPKYTMKLGLGWTAKEGTTLTDVNKIAAGQQSMPANFSTTSGTLETYAPQNGKDKGEYNIVGKRTALADKSAEATQKEKDILSLTEFTLQIQRNNTGYILRYLNEKNEVINEKTFYDDDRNKLTQIDKKNIYVGFFASRNADITVSDITLTTILPEEDDAAAAKEITYVDPDYKILSAVTSNSEEYELVYYGNADGKLTIVDAKGNLLAQSLEVSAKKKYSFGSKLDEGTNKFEIVFVPNSDYVPGDNQKLSNYNKWVSSHKVEYRRLGDVIYVAPNGQSTNDGSENSPVDVYTAVAYAAPGQTIYLAGGTYNLEDPILIDRGHDGTAKQPIKMLAKNTDQSNRPIFNFSNQKDQSVTSFTMAADYWHFKGFDVTKSPNAQKGIQVSGDHNVLELLKTYENGNTGIQISRYLGSDSYADWPSYNTVLNCTSYLNADAGYEDADGFAAKLTVADGNRFVGCIAAYNADDGWDLFAKVQSGSIGSVTIENCLAFKNGYVMDETHTQVINAGNGNGFKMGGDSMSGYHVLKNSVAFGNKAKGIDSNSCPDIQIYNSTSFDNESNNVAFYTNTAVNTDYYAEGILSLKTSNAVAENIKPVGTQNNNKIYGASNYYFNGSKSVNSEGKEASLDWFVNTDMESGIKGITRKTDGTIDMGDFLKLSEKAPANVGARLYESTSADEVLVASAEVDVYAGTVNTLAEVKLPEELQEEGYSWKYPETLTSVFAGTSVEFIAAAENKADRAVTVNFVEVTGVALELDEEALPLIGEDEVEITVVPVTAPEIDLEDVQNAPEVTLTLSETSRLGLSIANAEGSKDVWTVKRAANSGEGLAKLTAKITAAKSGTKTVTKQVSCSFITRAAENTISYKITDQTDGITIEGTDTAADKVTMTSKDSFTLSELKASLTGKAAANTKVNVSVSDTKVIKVDAAHKVTAVGSGYATIILTAAGDKTVVAKIPVSVEDGLLKTNVTTLTVDKAKTSGAQFVVVGENAVTGIVVASAKKGKNGADQKDCFAIENVNGNIYTISIKDSGTTIPVGTYTVELKTDNELPFEAITVKVIETKPVVSIKQPKKVNLFYKTGSPSGNGTLTASSKLAGVTLTQKDPDKDDFRLTATKSGYNVVLKGSAAGKKANQINKKVPVTVSFDGYKSAYNKDMVINVSIQTKAPKLVLEVDNRVLYTQLGITSTPVRIFNKDENTYVSGADVILANSKASYVNANKAFYLEEENGEYILHADKSGSAKISVQDADWAQEVVISQPITVNKSKPRVTIAASKLNGYADFTGLEQSTAVISVKNALDYKVKNLTLTGANSQATELLRYMDYEVAENDLGQQVLVLTLSRQLPVGYNGKCIFNGTYRFTANFGLNKLGDMKADVRVTISPTLNITTKQKGSIDLVNRTGSSITLTPAIRNLNGIIVGMSLADDASNQFDVEWDSAKGAAVITAKEEIDLKKGTRYKVTPIYEIELEYGTVEVTGRSFNIVPKQSTVKTTALSVLETRLSTGSPAMTTVVATSPAKAEILGMTQVSELDRFEIDYDAQSGNLAVYVLDGAAVKTGTTYRIAVELEVKDAGVNTKAQKITIPVKVVQ